MGKTYKKCFLASPMGDRVNDYRKRAKFVLNKLLNPAIMKLGYKASNVESMESTITWEVISETAECDLFVADLTDGNPNVLYELAFAHTIRKPTMLIVDSNQIGDTPFDVNQIHTMPYKYKITQGIKTSKKDIQKNQKELHSRIKKLLARYSKQITPISAFLNTINPIELLIKALPPDKQANHILETIDSIAKNLKSNGFDKQKLINQEPTLHIAHDDICRHTYGTARMRLTKDFANYCHECEEMIKRATGNNTNIITVQTPVKIDKHRSYKAAYLKYINATNKQIVSLPQPKYNRLYIVTENVKITKNMAMDFLRRIVRTALKNKITSLDNVELRFLKLSQALDHAFNNIDFHITSDKEFSVAFVPPSLRGDFGESIHVLDIEKELSKEITELAKNMWKKAGPKLCLTSHFYSRNKNYRDMIKKLQRHVNDIIEGLSVS